MEDVASILASLFAFLVLISWNERTFPEDFTIAGLEDVTEPSIKKAFLAKFDSARRHQLHRPKSKANKLTDAQKAKIAAQMRALRKQIEGDFDRNTVFEKRVDCSYPYPAASCKGHAKMPKQRGPPFADPPPFSVG